MIQLIGTALQLLLLLLGRWFKFTDEKKTKANELMKEVSGAKDVQSITSLFDRINSL